MSSSKKKTSKSDGIPKPIKIKKEKTEEDRTLHPISHYIDDRLELVKQIFGTLKPKTIKNLAPEFLKETKLDEIEELCLNELMCISTKRLKSIIDATRCPTDTDSSEDSDVQHKPEHVSLEEISSDSDIAASGARRAKRKKKVSTKASDNKNSESNETPGQISVLELLELQARARAIRSQLAMEPITKIEVDSDDEVATTSKQKETNPKVSKSKESPRKLKSKESTNSKEATNKVDEKNDHRKAEENASKKIKLKRNYRKVATPEQEKLEKEKPATTAEVVQEYRKSEPSKSRSASPDVIPIQTEPETLLISDSTDDENSASKEKVNSTVATAKQAEPMQQEPDSEPEEGEVREETELSEQTPVKSQQPSEISESKNRAPETEKEVPAAEPSIGLSEAGSISKLTLEETTTSVTDKGSSNHSAESAEYAANKTVPSIDDEDQNEDVISIGGDLEKEMIEELEKNEISLESVKSDFDASAVPKQTEPDEKDNDVISLDTSEDEREKPNSGNSESWRERYLKSSKVSQVLATSRLSKRVRDNIKKSKRSQNRNESEKDAKEKQEIQQQFTSKHEDGSMEQYQELLQHRQRKGSNNSKVEK